MKSPHTGKPMPIKVSRADMEFKGEHFRVWYMCYICLETYTRFTDDAMDKLNGYQAYQQYAEKHNLPIEEIMPK